MIPFNPPINIASSSPSMYIEGEDRLRFKFWNSLSGLAVRCYGQYVRLGSNKKVTFQKDFTPTSDRIVNFISYPFGTAGGINQTTPLLSNEDNQELGPGYLMGLDINTVSGHSRIGNCFVQVEINRGTGEPISLGVPLIAGYHCLNHHMGWPKDSVKYQVEGRGLIRTVTGNNPAAGAEITDVVPINARWLLKGLRFALTTHPTQAAVRTVGIAIDDGTSTIYDRFSPVSQNSGAVIVYTVHSLGGIDTTIQGPNSNRVYIPFPINGIEMVEGWKVGTITTNIQTGDDFSAPIYYLEEWIQD